MNNIVRITSGKFRGLKIRTPGGKTHPMGERERLALFNMISGYVSGVVVLDAYAGSGALGFEALSRGAMEVVFVDSSSEAVRCIVDNMALLGENAEVIRAKVSEFRSDREFDIIFADPPYDDFKIDEVISLTKFLKGGGVFVLSHPGLSPVISGLKLTKSRKYAGATLSIYSKIA